MNESEIDRIFELFSKDNIEELYIELSNVLGIDINDELAEEQLATGLSNMVGNIISEQYLGYFKSKCLQPENRNAYKQLKPEIPLGIRVEIDKELLVQDQINQITNEHEAVRFIQTSHDSSLKIQIAKQYFQNNESLILQLIQDSGDISLIQVIDNPSEQMISSLINNDRINLGNLEINNLINNIKKPSNEFLQNLLKLDTLSNSTKNMILSKPQLKISEQLALYLLKNKELKKIEIICRVENPSKDFQYNIILSNINNEHHISKILNSLDISQEVLYKCILNPQLYKYDTIKNRFISQVLESQGFNEFHDKEKLLLHFFEQPVNDAMLERKRQLLLQMHKSNDEIIDTIKYEMLDDKYVELLGISKINKISISQEVQKNIINMSDIELSIFVKIIDNYQEKSNDSNWENLFIFLMKGIKNSPKLIESIENINEIDIETLTQILISDNELGIEDINDINRIEELREEREKKYIEKGEISDIQKAVFSKLFGIDDVNFIDFAKFYNYANNIKDKKARRIVNELINIKNSTDAEQLLKIYNNGNRAKYTDLYEIDAIVRSEVTREFNSNLLNTSNLEELEPNVYKAGTDFNIIITSVGAFSDKKNKEQENYRESWNRPKIKTSHLCASYIRNDMLGIAPLSNVCYGFRDMEQSSLVQMNNSDISSSSWRTQIGVSSDGKNQYYSPSELIDTTKTYNEIDYLRTQNNKKKQPDYLIFFRRDGKYKMTEDEKIIWENTKKASKDFDDLPIVVIDIEECLDAERAKVQELLKSYDNEPSLQNIENLYHSIKNNRVTTERWGGEFYPEIDLEILEQQINTMRKQRKLSVILQSGVDATESITRSEAMTKSFDSIKEITQDISQEKKLDDNRNCILL